MVGGWNDFGPEVTKLGSHITQLGDGVSIRDYTRIGAVMAVYIRPYFQTVGIERGGNHRQLYSLNRRV